MKPLRLGTCLLMLGGPLACCGAPASQEARYTGTVVPETACGPASHGTLTTSKGRFNFAPDDGVLLLAGDVGAGGALSATLATQGADRKGYIMRFEGQMDPEHVHGRYTTPRCTFTVSFDRNHSRQFEVPYL